MRDVFFVSIYETNRSYGGPEEGGWWYDVGYPAYVRFIRQFRTRAAAERYLRRLKLRVVDKLNIGRRKPDSVLCDGWYEVRINTNELPAYYPTERPYYE